MILARKIKEQTDRVLRQSKTDPTAGITVKGDGQGPVIVNPAADLSKHKVSADHDGRYYTQSEVDTLLAATAGRKEAVFTDVNPWILNHNLGYLPLLAIWEMSSTIQSYGDQAYGTSFYGGSTEIFTLVNPEAAVVEQRNPNTTRITWAANKTGKVVYV